MNVFVTPTLIALAFLGLLALLVVGASFIRLLGRMQMAESHDSTYEAVPALLTPAERSFFGVLQHAVASDYQVFAKVRLADIIRPVRNPSRSGWQAAFNRITGKHVDFLLCQSSDLCVVGVIELDDRSHERFERGFRDDLVDSALSAAGIPVLRISARQSYSPAQIREQITSSFQSRRRIATANSAAARD